METERIRGRITTDLDINHLVWIEEEFGSEVRINPTTLSHGQRVSWKQADVWITDERKIVRTEKEVGGCGFIFGVRRREDGVVESSILTHEELVGSVASEGYIRVYDWIGGWPDRSGGPYKSSEELLEFIGLREEWTRYVIRGKGVSTHDVLVSTIKG